MNVDSSIGKALFSGGASATVNSQSQAATPEGSDGSLFQKLISRVLAVNSMKTGTAGGNTGEDADGTAQDKAGGTGGDLLAGLLLGGNLTGAGIEGATLLAADTAAGSQEEPSKTDGPGGMMEALLALTGGLVPAQAADGNAIPAEAAADPSGTLISAIGQTKTDLAGSGTLNGKEAGIAAQVSGTQTLAGLNANPQQGGMTNANAAVMTGGEAPVISGEMDLSEIGKDGPAAGKTGNLQTVSPQKFSLSETGTGLQPVEEGSKAQEQNLDDMATQGQNQKAGMTNASGTTDQNPLAQIAGTAEPYSQISNEILSRAGAATEFNGQLEQKGPMEFKMQLEPADLGQIDIKLKFSEGKLMIDILAANSKTQTLLISQVDKLISSMGLQNVQVESVQVSQQMNSQSQSGQGQGYTMNSAMDFSQRSHQEQYGQEAGNSVSTAASVLQGDDLREAGTASRIESLRYGSHRMNYAV